MNEPNQHDSRSANPPVQPPMPNGGSRFDASETPHDARRKPSTRHSSFPKDDRRSSTLLTERERAERWPLG